VGGMIFGNEEGENSDGRNILWVTVRDRRREKKRGFGWGVLLFSKKRGGGVAKIGKKQGS